MSDDALQIFDRSADLMHGITPQGMGITVGRMRQILMFCFRVNPDLEKCDPYGVVAAVAQVASLGLDLAPALGHVYLIPFKVKQQDRNRLCQLVIGYRGYASLATRNGVVKHISANPVYERDVFEHEEGTSPRIMHRKSLHADRGDVVAAYSIADFGGDHRVGLVCGMGEIQGARAKSATGRSENSPWHTDFASMARKTPIRRQCKDMDLGTVVAHAMASDDMVVTGLGSLGSEGGTAQMEYVRESDDGPASEPAKSAKERIARKKPTATPDQLAESLSDFGASASRFHDWLAAQPEFAGKDIPPVSAWDAERLGWAVAALRNGIGDRFRAAIQAADDAEPDAHFGEDALLPE